MTVIAFIGLGHMGGPMAANLARAGHTVRGCDRDETARAAAQQAGITVVADAAEAVAGAEAVITMLPSGEILRAVYAEAVPAAAAGTLLIDCSTVAVDDARAAADTARAAGLQAVDAPVSGGVVGAEAATLTFMVGGADEAVDRARPLLEAMGKKVVHCGDAGAGQAAKICNNMILGISMVAVSEAFVLGEKLGLSHQALYDVASAASGQCWALTTNCPVPGPVPGSPANRDYEAGFASGLMAKDLGLAAAALRAHGVPGELGAAVAERYAQLRDHGHGDKDFSDVINHIRSSAGEGTD